MTNTHRSSEFYLWLIGMVIAFGAMGCASEEADSAVSWETMDVTATSFTLAEEETKRGNIGLTAFGDQLEPGDKAIAVSRDLIKAGLCQEDYLMQILIFNKYQQETKSMVTK